MRYLRLALTWGPGERPDWGTHIDYFEIGADGRAVRQINAHSSGPSLKYDVTHPADSYGFLADAPFPPSAYPLESGDGEAREISAEEFEALWASTQAINRTSMNLADVCGRLREFDRESTIYAREPWTPTSEAVVTAEPEHRDGRRPVAAAGMRYFIEVSIALEFLDGWQSSLTVPPTPAARAQRLIEFAMHDA